MSHNSDFKDLFSTFNAVGVEYLVVGAHAVIFYAEPRYTKDLDVWVSPTPANAARIWDALARFGAPLRDISREDFTDEELVYQIGLAPNRIDILMGIAGVNFGEAWQRRVESTYDGVPIHVIAKDDLIAAKRASNRKQDQLDVERLEAAP